MIDEKWVNIISIPNNYQISNIGNVRKKCKKYKDYKLVNGFVLSIGYKAYSINNVVIYAHRLVATYFLDNIHNYPCVNHKDGNKLNNSVYNLEWCTHKHNIQHAVKMGLRTSIYGTSVNTCKLTESEVLCIYNSLDRNKQLALKYNIDASLVYDIKRGNIWKKVTGGKDVSIKRKTFTHDEILSINKQDGTVKEIAKLFNVSISSVRKIKKQLL
jgi:hypothetical protein